MNDQIIRGAQHEGFRDALRRYFGEMNIRVTNWDGLFRQMDDDGDPVILRTDDGGQVVGFIMFVTMSMTSWFFESRHGFVREFWVAPGYRGRGHGGALLAQAEAWFRDRGIGEMILTTDTACDFYLRRGYRRDENTVAKNRAPVYRKRLETGKEVGR